MLSKKDIEEIRGHLESAQNPIFFYDNDADGFCSYILLRKMIGRGKGVAIRSRPYIEVGYARKVQELNADYIFVLDRPYLGKDFVEEIKSLGLPIVWIDHHEYENEKYDYENIFLYNPALNKTKSTEPVTYWSYKIANKPELMWIAMMGCIADHHLPDFVKEFSNYYGEYWGAVKKPFEAYYQTGIGSLARAIGFGLKDSVTHVVYLQNFLINCNSPSEMFLELDSKSSFAHNYREIKKKYDALISKASKYFEDELIFFSYSGDLSISSELANEICFKNPDKIVMIAYANGSYVNMSIRGKGVRKVLEKILPMFEGASGGGHDDAVGARVKSSDIEEFKSSFIKES